MPAWQLAAATLLYVVSAVVVTWPVAEDPFGTFLGSGDPVGHIAQYRELVEGGHNPFAAGRLEDISAPDGQPIAWPRALASAPSVLLFYGGTALFGAIGAINAYVLLGFVLTGLSVFLFARRLTGDVGASMLAGWAVAFFPYALIKAGGHYDFVHAWPLVLAAWAVLELAQRPTRRTAVLAGAAVVLAMWWTAYYILFGGVLYATLAVVGLVAAARARRFRPQLAAQALTGAIVGAFLVALLVLASQAPEALGTRTNDLANLTTYSARPFEYVVPPAAHPVWGGATKPWLVERLHGSNPAESTLYVGISVLLVALLTVVALLRRRLAAHLRLPVAALAVLALVAVVFSAPPNVQILGVTIPFPARAVFEVSSTWRVYARFVMVAMIALGLLLAIGVAAARRQRTGRARAAILAVAAAVVAFDLWTDPDPPVNDDSAPAVYAALKQAPDGLVAEYPIVPNGFGVYDDIFFQDAHDKPIVNGYTEGSNAEKRALTVARLDEPDVGRRLSAMGVRYVVVKDKDPGYGLPRPGSPPASFRLLSRDATRAIYAVPRVPGAALASPAEGFDRPESLPEGGWLTWLVADRGRLEVAADCAPCRARLSFDIYSFAQPRTVTIRAANGRVLVRRKVDRLQRIEIPMTVDREAAISIEAAPGPQSIAEATKTPDPRNVAVGLRDVRVDVERDRRR
jgi:hypothetical protein